MCSLLTSQCPSLVFSRARIKANVQSLYSILKYSSVQHPASLACISSCGLSLCCSIQAPSWRLWAVWLLKPCSNRQNRCMHCANVGQEQERGRALLCSSEVITRKLSLGRTRRFLNMTNQLPRFSQALVRVHFPVRLTGLCGPAPHPVPLKNLVTEGGREKC